MRTAMTALLVAGVVAAMSSAADAQRSRFPQNSGMVTQEAYNRCFHLALARGQNMSNSDRYSLELFMAACLAGRIPF
jgi:hypothetical protein